MKRVFAIIVLLVWLVENGGSQTPNRRLVLTGTVISVGAEIEWYRSSDTLTTSYGVVLYLQFRNNSDRPVIILRPDSFYGVKKLSFFRTMSSQSESESESLSWQYRSPINYDPIPSFVRALSSPEPPKREFVIIDAGGYYECREPLTVKIGYSIKPGTEPKIPDFVRLPSKLPPRPDRPEIPFRMFASKSIITSDFSALKVEYSLSLRNRREGESLFEDAKERWRKFGDLFLDSNGDYNVTSEVIINKPSN